MIFNIGKDQYNVLWGTREEKIQLYPQHRRGVKKRTKESFTVTTTNCVIAQILDQPKITCPHFRGYATCSPKEIKFDDNFGKRLSLMRAIDQLLLNKVPGKEDVDRLIRRALKIDIIIDILDKNSEMKKVL